MPDVAELLAEADWLTRLARSLTGSAAEADDAVQDTYVAALRSPPDPDRPARPWLRRVLVNVVRMRHRGRVRRDAREAELLGDDPHTPEQLLERARVERTLSDLVLSLDEPYRTTVLLRYREGLTAAAIAAREGVPAGTVRRRLKTAVDRLRSQLDDNETSKTWRAAFAPFLVTTKNSSSPWWRILMASAATKTGVAVIAAVVLLLGGGAAWWWNARSTSIEPTTATATSAAVKQLPIDPSGANAAKVFAQAGVATRSVVGRVTFQGKPFAGATVRIVHALTRTAVAEQTSGADGTFTFAGLAADAYVASAAADDKTAMPVVIELRAPKPPSVELSLVACSHLRGIVSDGSGAPIAHAHVARAETAWPFAETNELGHYDLCTHFGDAQILFTASGYHGVTAGVGIKAVTQRDMVLLPEATVAGTVVEDGKPVANAWVTIDPRGKGDIRDAAVRTRSAADGSFRMTGVASGRSELSAIAPGLASRPVGVVIGPGETREGLVVRLDRASTITGHVMSAGSPVVGASVGLRIGGLPYEVLAVTQADGSFTIDRAPIGELGVLVAHYTVIKPHTVSVVKGDVRVEIEARPFGNVMGIVRRHGIPASDVTVSCPSATVTGLDGLFTCEMTNVGPFSLLAEDSDGRWGVAQGILTNGETTHIAIDLEQEGQICGTVSDETGQKLRGITIGASNPRGDDTGDDVSGDDGVFCVRYLGSDGTFTINVMVGGQHVDPVTPIPPVILINKRADIAIVLAAPKLGITGVVVDAAGAPVPDVAVRVHAGSHGETFVFDNSSPLLVSLTDQNGRFSIGRLAAGSYALLATSRDGSEQTQPSVVAGTNDLRIVLAAAGSIEGTLVGFSTTPTILGIALAGGHEPVDVEVDDDHFSATGLSPGPYLLSANTGSSTGGGDAKRVVVVAGTATTVTMTSRGTATLTGKVIDWKTRAPIAGARCSAPAARDGKSVGVVYMTPSDGAISDANGVYLLEGASAGDVIVSCGNNVAHGMRLATVARDSVTPLDVYIVTSDGRGTIDARFADLGRTFDQIGAGGQAEKAGLLVGDEVVAVEGVSVTELSGDAAMAAITNNPSKTIALAIKRGAQVRTINVFVRPPDN